MFADDVIESGVLEQDLKAAEDLLAFEQNERDEILILTVLEEIIAKDQGKKEIKVSKRLYNKTNVHTKERNKGILADIVDKIFLPTTQVDLFNKTLQATLQVKHPSTLPQMGVQRPFTQNTYTRGNPKMAQEIDGIVTNSKMISKALG
uniref:Reverse transcriptase n=1 Tax=Ditylenchus dipsaci TaxID=166011 RepID=A0A915EME3_9BILA